jgi:hypothetical protein
MAFQKHPLYYKNTGQVFNYVGTDSVLDPGSLESNRSATVGCYDNNMGLYTSPETQYFPLDVLTDRPMLTGILVSKNTILADAVDAAVITGIPAGSQIIIQSTTKYFDPITMDSSGTLNFTAGTKSTYTIEIESFPYQLYKITIVAN